jgi:predicted RND superfamily exporter protein
MGVLWAMFLTFALLPTLTIWLARTGRAISDLNRFIDAYAKFVVRRRVPVFWVTSGIALLLITLIPLNHIDDDPINYFDRGVPFRDASEFAIERGFGVNDLNFSLSCGEPGCVNSLEYLEKLQAFETYLESEPSVIHVANYSEVLRRLNKSMNGDNDNFLKLPDSDELAAQYNLLYEMSLPFGLDLNNQVNIDKSATRVAILAEQMVTEDVIALEQRATEWLKNNHPEIAAPGSSVTVMFAHIGIQNTLAMLFGGAIAVLGITLTILLALRSFRYAFVSMIPNSVPALMAFGVWGGLVGFVNMAAAAVFSISLGIVVDDTVHFISKYRRGREVKGLSPEESIYYAFSNVGSALIVTTIVLSIGFALLMLSDFGLNSTAGLLTAITISLALIFDFLILPPILMFFDRGEAGSELPA